MIAADGAELSSANVTIHLATDMPAADADADADAADYVAQDTDFDSQISACDTYNM